MYKYDSISYLIQPFQAVQEAPMSKPIIEKVKEKVVPNENNIEKFVDITISDPVGVCLGPFGNSSH